MSSLKYLLSVLVVLFTLTPAWGDLAIQPFSERTIREMDTLLLFAQVSGANGGVSYKWSIESDPTGQALLLSNSSFQSIEFGVGGGSGNFDNQLISLKVEATDSVTTVSESVAIRVKGVNRPPVIENSSFLGTPEDPLPAGAGLAFSLGQSYDPDNCDPNLPRDPKTNPCTTPDLTTSLMPGGIGGAGICSGEPPIIIFGFYTTQPSMTIPNLLGLTSFRFKVSSRDGMHVVEQEFTAWAAPTGGACGVNQPPQVTASANPASVAFGQAVQLNATASDPEGGEMTFNWQQIEGTTVSITNAASLNASFTAPSVNATLRFRFTATDQHGASGSATVQVVVGSGSGAGAGGTCPPAPAAPSGPGDDMESLAGCESGNQPAIANAGPDRSVNSGQRITLRGSGSDPDDTKKEDVISGFPVIIEDVTYQWEVLNNAGLNIQLEGATTDTVCFLAPAVGQPTVVTLGLTVLDPLGCGSRDRVNVTIEAATGSVNQPPQVTASANPSSAAFGQVVQLVATASDPEGGEMTFNWQQIEGTTVSIANAGSLNASFTALSVDTTLRFRFTATDQHGASGSATVQVVVGSGAGGGDGGGVGEGPCPPAPAAPSGPGDDMEQRPGCESGNQPAIANAGPDRSVNSGQRITLRGSGSDPDNTSGVPIGGGGIGIGGGVTYGWEVLNNAGLNIQLEGADTDTVCFLAPAVGQPTVVTLGLTVLDPLGCGSRDRVNVTIEPAAGAGNTPPVANAGSNKTVSKGQDVLLEGSGSDPDGDDITFAWTQVSGPAVTLAGANSATASFTAPSLAQDAQLVFRLTVTDDKGASGSSEVTVTVLGNQPPVITSLTPDQSVGSGSTVDLEVSATDPDDDDSILTYQWTQTAGPPVSLENAGAANASFTAPTVDEDTPIEIRVAVSDGLAEVNATVEITVQSRILNTLVFPASVGAESRFFNNTFIGVAILNPNPEENEVDISGVDTGGNPSPATLRALSPKGQSAFLADEVDSAEDVVALIARGRQGPIQGFFMVGDGEGQRLDGIGGKLEEAKRLFFPIARHTEEQETLLFLFNPAPEENGENGETAEVTLTLFSPGGIALETIETTIPPSGALIRTLAGLFGEGEDQGPTQLDEENTFRLEDGYVTVDSDQPLKGFQFFATADSYSSLTAQVPRLTRELLVPHFFVDANGGDTELRLLNADPERNMLVEVRAYDDDFQQVGVTGALEIEPGHLRVLSIKELLELDTSQLGGHGVYTGHLRLRVWRRAAIFTPAVSVIGSVSFSGNGGKFSSTLPMIEEGRTETLYLHVAQAAGLFTGFAVLNAGDEPTTVKVEVFDTEGILTGERQFDLSPGRRQVGILEDPLFFGGGFSQMGGHVRVTSTGPAVTFALFGDFDGEFLSAIEGQPPAN